MDQFTMVVLLVGGGAVVFGATLLVRRVRPGLADVDTAPAGSILSYVAATFGILVGFLIVVLLGEATSARHAIGDEATSIGTAFDEAQLFPENEADLQHALICYARSVTEKEWPALAEGGSAPETDAAYRELIAAYGAVDEPTGGTFQSAAATNSFVQIGSISTARETRLVASELDLGPLIWTVLIGAALLVVFLLFVVTLPARPLVQASLLGLVGLFTTVLLVLLMALSSPFREGTRLASPELIEENTARMVSLAPEAAERPCAFDNAG
ncbi:hypothetical protein GCM10023216_06680 [Isoptericola chiayiensis]|uniref:DUF4239 domain-containing protein n=1 Tax=Isoptericola chiayiensis TaxID=579446 RepID=A0ABP8Y3C1_9MICO|nr:DUF4239 domain-containing protein [Isoptericola chiayiensis]NOV99372.1 hypothetical protein [Isoptericola chiayiensis]